jgi:hypothetical protein
MYLVISVRVFFLAMAAIALQDRFPSFLGLTSTNPILCDRRQIDCQRHGKATSHKATGPDGRRQQRDVC